MLWAVVAIPLQSPEGWHELSFKDHPANRVIYSPSGMSILVRKSASPLIYKLPEETSLNEFQIDFKVTGTRPSIKNRAWPEDSVLRVGLVFPGKNRMGSIERAMAADWLIQLQELSPPDKGVGQILFLMAVPPGLKIGSRRIHPLSKLIEEELSIEERANSFQHWVYKFKKTLKVMALWLAVDGDNTKVDFTTEISKFILKN